MKKSPQMEEEVITRLVHALEPVLMGFNADPEVAGELLVIRAVQDALQVRKAKMHAEAPTPGIPWRDELRHRITEPTKLIDVLTDSNLVERRAEARRLVAQGAVMVAGLVEKDPDTLLSPSPAGTLVRVGRKRVMRVLYAAPDRFLVVRTVDELRGKGLL